MVILGQITDKGSTKFLKHVCWINQYVWGLGDLLCNDMALSFVFPWFGYM